MIDAQVRSRLEQPSYLSEFLMFLTTRPELDEICSHLVLTWPNPDVIQHAAIGRLDSDATITFPGWFGYEPEIPRVYRTTSIWDDIPSSVAVRERKVVLCADRSEITAKFPHLASAMPNLGSVIAAPLISNLTPLGTFVVSSTQPLDHQDHSTLIAEHYALALSLYVAIHHASNGAGQRFPGQNGNQASPNSNGRTTPSAPRRQTLVPNQLTERQLLVLQYMAEEYSNRQIAMRVGFSESTVRQETMAIYAFLGVNGRKEAIEAAQVRGMVPTFSDDDIELVNTNE